MEGIDENKQQAKWSGAPPGLRTFQLTLKPGLECGTLTEFNSNALVLKTETSYVSLIYRTLTLFITGENSA